MCNVHNQAKQHRNDNYFFVLRSYCVAKKKVEEKNGTMNGGSKKYMPKEKQQLYSTFLLLLNIEEEITIHSIKSDFISFRFVFFLFSLFCNHFS